MTIGELCGQLGCKWGKEVSGKISFFWTFDCVAEPDPFSLLDIVDIQDLTQAEVETITQVVQFHRTFGTPIVDD